MFDFFKKRAAEKQRLKEEEALQQRQTEEAAQRKKVEDEEKKKLELQRQLEEEEIQGKELVLQQEAERVMAEEQRRKEEEESQRKQEEELKKKEEFERKRQEYKKQQEEKAELWRKEEEQKKKYEQEQKQREKQELIEHLLQGEKLTTKIENCMWLNSINNQLIDVTVILQDNSVFFRRDDNKSMVFSERPDSYFSTISVRDTELYPGQFSISFIIDGEFKGGFVTKNPNDVDVVKGHLETVDQVKGIRLMQFETNVRDKVQAILENKDIVLLMYNFISKTDKNYFLDSDYLVGFEKVLHAIDKIGIRTLECDPDRNNWPESVEIEEVKSYYFDSFGMLVKLLRSKDVFSPEEEANFSTWLLLRKVAVNYFFDSFNVEYGDYFEKLNAESSIGEFISVYVRIETINIESVTNASLLTYFYMVKTGNVDQGYLHNYEAIKNELIVAIKNKELNNFEASLLQPSDSGRITVNDIDMMAGHDFERFVGSLFSRMGYKVEVTKGSGDQGIDVIAEKDGRKFGIQTKCYGSAVNNKAIQEAAAGIRHYRLDKGIVVTNNYFTDSAVELAASNGIILWDRTILKEKIEEFF